MSTAIVLSEQSSHLANLDQARQMLAECRTLSQVKKIRNIAEAAKVYARAAHLGRESQNYAAEIALLAACKAGEILKQLDKSQGGRPNEKTAATLAVVSEYAQTLKDTQTPERTARYWQKLAEVPEETTLDYIEKIKTDAANPLRNKDPEDITASGLLRVAARIGSSTEPTGTPPDWDLPTLLEKLTNCKINSIEGDAFATLAELTIKKLKTSRSDQLNATIETLHHAANILAGLANSLQQGRAA